VQVLGDRVSAGLAAAVGGDGSGVATWFTAAVGAPCTLVRQLQGARSPVLGRSDRHQPRSPLASLQTSATADAASAVSARDTGGAEAQVEQDDLLAGLASGEPGLTSISSRGGGDSIGEHNVYPPAGHGAPSLLASTYWRDLAPHWAKCHVWCCMPGTVQC